MELSKKHKDFADLVIQGLEPKHAYKKVYPKSSDHSALTKGRILWKKEDINNYIKQNTKIIDENKVNMVVEQQKELYWTNLCTAEKNFEILANIAYSTTAVIEDVAIFEGAVFPFKRHSQSQERVSAIKVINQMKGFDAPKKIAQTDVNGNDKMSTEDIEKLNDFVAKLNSLK